MMHEQKPLEIGDVFAWEPPPTVLGPALVDARGSPATEWYILRSAPQKEVAACIRLKVLGVAEAWFPVEGVWRQKRGALVPVRMERRIAPGYLFTAWEHEPRWHLLRDLSRGTVSGVVSIGDVPWSIPEETMGKMAKVPERIEALRREAEDRFLADRIARQPRRGEPARLLAGPFAGETVMVDGIRGDRVEWTLGAIKGTASVTALERFA